MIKNIGIIFALVASMTWGLVYNIDQRILLKTSPLTMFVVGGIMQLVILIPYIFTKTGYQDIALILSDKSQLRLLLFAEILLIIAGTSILYAIKYLNAPIASVFEISYPLFVVLFYYTIFNGSTLNTNFWIGAGLIFIGSVVVMK